MEYQGFVIKPLEGEAGRFRMCLEAEKFAEELCQFHKSLGASDDLAKWLADGWLSSFHGMYERNCDYADGIEHIDRGRTILRRDIPIKEKLAQLQAVNPMARSRQVEI
jgi:hypothetical protein